MRLRSHVRARSWIVPAIVAALLATSCSEAEPIDVREQARSAARVRPAGHELAQVVAASAELSGAAGELTNICLEQMGFPQAQAAASLVRRVPRRYHPSVLGVVPLDMGPSTYREARAFGFAGTPLAIEDDAHGFVVSNSDDFDMAADGCFELVHETFPELAALQSDAAAFGDGVRRALVRRLTPGLTRALLARFSCVREAGFPRLEPAAAVEEPSLERILRSAGVQPGVAGETAGEKTSEDVRAREVTVFDPPPARTYRPSAEEKQFADAYVRCGRQQRFTARLRESVKVSLAVLESRFQTRADSLADRLTRLGDDLVSTTTLGR